MADTFFIGQLNDPLQVAAATIAMPCFMFLTAFANLFGMGGIVALLYGIAIMLLEPLLFPILGAKAETWEYLEQYVFWTIGVGALPTVMNAELAHLIRAEGYAKQAGFGVALGGILNIALDPLFIFVFRLNIAGAAIATMLSNLIAMLYFIAFLLRIRKKTVITLNPRTYMFGCNIPAEVLTVGLPGFVMTMMSTISNTALNHIVASYSNTAIAGMGIAKKGQPLFLSLLRKGSLDIVFMLLLDRTMWISGIAWATPFADWIAFVISLLLLVPCLLRLGKEKFR